jgi:alpha-N-acetylglucosamine transferase
MRRNQRVRFASEILIVSILLLYFQFLKPTRVCEDKTDWTQYAYIQYVTNSDYLCNSVMLFETLHRLGSKADRLMLVPSQFAAQESKGDPLFVFTSPDFKPVYSHILHPFIYSRYYPA